MAERRVATREALEIPFCSFHWGADGNLRGTGYGSRACPYRTIAGLCIRLDLRRRTAELGAVARVSASGKSNKTGVLRHACLLKGANWRRRKKVVTKVGMEFWGCPEARKKCGGGRPSNCAL